MPAQVLSTLVNLEERNGTDYRSWAADPVIEWAWDALSELIVQSIPTLLDWFLTL